MCDGYGEVSSARIVSAHSPLTQSLLRNWRTPAALSRLSSRIWSSTMRLTAIGLTLLLPSVISADTRSGRRMVTSLASVPPRLQPPIGARLRSGDEVAGAADVDADSGRNHGLSTAPQHLCQRTHGPVARPEAGHDE